MGPDWMWIGYMNSFDDESDNDGGGGGMWLLIGPHNNGCYSCHFIAFGQMKPH